MKKLSVLVLIILIVLVLWLFIKQAANTKTQSPNVVSNSNVKVANENHQKSSQVILMEPSEIDIDADALPLAETPAKKRSYLSVYRDIQIAKECNHFYQENHKEKGHYDFLKVLNNAYRFQVGENLMAPTIQQESMDYFVGNCLTLKDDVFKRANIIEEFPEYQFSYPVLVELKKELKQVMPKTKAEQELANAIKFGEEWQKKAMNLRKVSLGDFKLAESEREALQAQALTLSDEIAILYQNYPIDANELSRLEKAIETLHELRFERLPVDPEKLKQAEQSFSSVNSHLLKMTQLGNPDVFSEVMMRMHFNERFDMSTSILTNNFMFNSFRKIVSSYRPPSQLIKTEAGVLDSVHFDLLIKPAGFLYLCYLGDDCGPNSAMVRTYCLDIDNHHIKTYEEACGKNLIDFYSEDYLTPNQWLDVSYLFDVMVSYYEN